MVMPTLCQALLLVWVFFFCKMRKLICELGEEQIQIFAELLSLLLIKAYKVREVHSFPVELDEFETRL